MGIDDLRYLNALVQTNHSSDRALKCSHLQAMREGMMRRESSKRAWHSRSSKQLRAGCPHACPRTTWQLSAPGVKKRAFPAMHLTHRGEVKRSRSVKSVSATGLRQCKWASKVHSMAVFLAAIPLLFERKDCHSGSPQSAQCG